MNKKEIAEILEQIAILLEFKNENPFKIRAYRNAARSLLNMEEDLEDVILAEKLTDYEGIGDHTAEKITTLYKTDKLPYYEQLKKTIPSGLLDLLEIQGLGVKKIKVIYKRLGIKSIPALKKACEAGKIAKLPRFGKKTEQNILDAISHVGSYQQRHLWWDAMETAAPILAALRKLKGVKKAEIAGSLRRKLETIGDLDFLVGASDPEPIMDWFTSQKFVEKVLSKGKTKSSIRLRGGIQADLRIVPEKQFGYALAYFTGSKEHNIKMRERALKRGWSLSEYGLSSLKPKKPEPFDDRKTPVTEADLFKIMGLDAIPPEIREDAGEFDAAEKGKLPILVEEDDIRGTFHNHTASSDGRNSLSEMVMAAQTLGWEYIGISDHSKSSIQANGLDEERLMTQISQIRKLNASGKFKPYIFAGTECDILPNGSLDFLDSILKKLDYVIVSVHSAFAQDEKTMTKRIIKAIEHPYTTMVGHVTGRLLLRRDPYAVNLTKVIDACIANGKIMEINANPMRLDMDWRLWHAASQKGLFCSINTDAHSTDNLEFFRAGVNIARKGWLEKKHILNTRSLKQVQKFLQKSKESCKTALSLL